MRISRVDTRYSHAVFNFPRNCPSAPNELSYPHHVPRRSLMAYKVLMRMTRVREYQQAVRFISPSALMTCMGAGQSFHPKRKPQAFRFPSSNAVLSHLPPTQNVQWTDTTHEKQLRSVPDYPCIIYNIVKRQPILDRLHTWKRLNGLSASTCASHRRSHAPTSISLPDILHPTTINTFSSNAKETTPHSDARAPLAIPPSPRTLDTTCHTTFNDPRHIQRLPLPNVSLR